MSLALAAVYGGLVLLQAFASDYVIQDDARQHVFWTQRYADPTLFPDDLIADYFQAAAPIGYAGLYKGMVILGVDPIVFSKLLPPLLGLITVGYTFFLCLEIFPVPIAGFLASAMLSQTLWVSDELSSGTPRAFLYPLLVAFLYYLLRRATVPCLLLIGLQVLFYPQAALISLSLVALRLLHWQRGKFSLSRDWQAYLLLAVGACFVLGLVLYRDTLSAFGDIVTRAEAAGMVEFQEGGRNAFFKPGMAYWLDGYPGRSGMFHRHTTLPVTLLAGVLLPIFSIPVAKSRLAWQIRPTVVVLGQVLVVSVGWFFLAHLLLFELHLPSRYTSHTIRIVLAVASGIVWAIALAALSHGSRFSQKGVLLQRSPAALRLGIAIWGQIFPLVLTAGFLTIMLFYYPLLIGNFPKVGYEDFADSGPLYEFLAAQPQDSLVVTLSDEANNIPTFAARSVLVAREYSLAYHTDYYGQLRQRMSDLIEAQYTPDPSRLAQFVETYEPTVWLVEDGAFQPAYLSDHRWRQQFQPVAQTAALALQQGTRPALQETLPTCTLQKIGPISVLEANCIRQIARRSSLGKASQE